MHPVETYLQHLAAIHATGGAVAETSYYGALENLLDEIGGNLKPKVRCVPQLKNVGAGAPDFGLYTASQFQRAKDKEPPTGTLPERGVIEVKSWDDDSFLTAKGTQVSKYWKRYGLVLVTNYRDFVLVGRDKQAKPVRLETYRMADTEAAFRALLAHPRKSGKEHGDRLVEFLRRAMLYAAPLADPEDLAWFLASYAREARYRVELAAALPALAGLKKGLEEALGMKFEGDKGEHFFRATLVQTLFYGVFSSWVLWARTHPGPDERFNWHEAGWTLHVPMIKSLFDQIATPSQLKPLGVAEVLDWAGDVLNRVDRASFFQKFEQHRAVQYFYEPFLKAYDPELRKELGVWYTPPEIVKYQVERVDRVLREELDIDDGLADERVVILDPCCGTGAYLVETLKRIHRTLEEKNGGALTAQQLKRAAAERVIGFEILPAPFVVAHLQLGLMLRQLGAPLDNDSDERTGVYLTNALTGWEPLKEPKNKFPLFPELMEERAAANKVKQETPILVIIGNPPYNGYAGIGMDEERDLSTAYRATKRAPKPEGQGLNDLYVRFFRMAERRIVEKSGRGIVCFISNYSWLEGLSHTGMRERYLEVFDRVWVDNLHGDRIISEYAPDGCTSETVFAMGGQLPGIKVGTAIVLLSKSKITQKKRRHDTTILYRDRTEAKAADRRKKLLSSLQERRFSNKSRILHPIADLGYPFKPATVDAGYLTWPLLPELFPISFPGVQTCRDEFLVDIDRDRLEERIAAYFNAGVANEEISRRWPSVMEKRARYEASQIRDYLVKRGRTKGRIVRFAYRPFDIRWLYWEPETKLLDEKRGDYFPQVFEGNLWLAAAQHHRRDFDPPMPTLNLGCRHLYERGANLFPTHLIHATESGDLLVQLEDGPRENISPDAKKYLKRVSGNVTDLFHHCLSVFYSAEFVSHNSFVLRQDWPRIPLPATKKGLLASAKLGRRVAGLLDTEKPVAGVTSGKLDPRLKSIGKISKVGGGALDPARGHLDLTAGWGHAGKGGVCMPGKGKIAEHAEAGEVRYDVYLNETAYWADVPKEVWDYHIGGYQVIKKWLSYREREMLGRGLKLDEAEYVSEMVRRLAALILLRPELDANYRAVKADTWPWPKA